MGFCDLTGKNIVVTGASSGLGRATCIRLSRLSATVCLMGRDRGRLRETRTAMQEGNHRIEDFDLTDFTLYRARFKELVGELGPLHGLVHFAGIRKAQPLRAMRVGTLHELFAIHLDAFIELVKQFTRKNAVSADGASIVAASSVAAFRGIPSLAGYGASKAGLDAAVRALAIELAGRRIRVNSVAPGHVETEMNLAVKESLSEEAYRRIESDHPLGLGEPEDVANLVAFLLSDEARWLTGAVLPIDGGFSASP